MQKLIAKHRQELAATRDKAAADAKAAADQLREQHERELKQQRDKLLKVRHSHPFAPLPPPPPHPSSTPRPAMRHGTTLGQHLHQVARCTQQPPSTATPRTTMQRSLAPAHGRGCPARPCPQEAEEGVERERGASAARLREACERYEQQISSQRLR